MKTSTALSGDNQKFPIARSFHVVASIVLNMFLFRGSSSLPTHSALFSYLK